MSDSPIPQFDEMTRTIATMRSKMMALERQAGQGLFNPENWIALIREYDDLGLVSNAANARRRFNTLSTMFSNQPTMAPFAILKDNPDIKVELPGDLQNGY